MSNVFSVHQRHCLISHTSAYVGAIRRSVTRPLMKFSVDTSYDLVLSSGQSCDKRMDSQTDKVATKSSPFGCTTRHPKSGADEQMT